MTASASPPSGSEDQGRLVQLDSLRALALFAVIIHHNVALTGLPFVGNIGNGALAMFFVLSGYLITGILVRARSRAEQSGASLKDVIKVFYIRRSLRIFPVYYFVLTLVLLGGALDIRRTFPFHALYLTNFLVAFRGEYVFPQHFWSMSVEEQFYLAWAPLVLFMPRRRLMPLLGAMLAIGPISRVVLYALSGNKATAVTPTTSSMDLLALGCLLALLQSMGPAARTGRIRLRRGFLVVAPLLVAITTWFELRGNGFLVRIGLHTLPWALLAFWYIDRASDGGFTGSVGRFLQWRPLVFIGTISYGAYLYHNLILLTVRGIEHRFGIDIPFPEQPGPLRALATGGIAILVATLSWFLFEKRLNDKRRRFPYVKRTPSATAIAETVPGPSLSAP